VHKGYWWESQNERDHWVDQDVGGWTMLKLIIERLDEMVRIGFIWIRTRTGAGLL
jgi:hypothetical protein